jgi:hypothetical protein
MALDVLITTDRIALARLPLAREQSAEIGNSCLTVGRFTLDIDRDSIAGRKCLFERLVE